MPEIVQIISQLGIDSSEVFAELEKVNAKYGQSTEAIRKQKEEVDKLTKEEAALLAQRAKTNSPSIVAQFNKELEKTRAELLKANTALKANESALKETAKSGKSLGDNLGKAFEATSTKAVSLRSQLRGLKEQLANTDDDEEFLKLSIEAGKLEDKIQDANDAARIFASDSKFESVSKAFGSIGSKLLALDFKGAAQSSQLLLKATSQITFKETLSGIKNVGSTLLNVGKSLLLNPIFLLGAAILLIITNFDKLKNSGGAVGTVFKFIGKIIDGITKSFSDLSDAIGLTDTAAQEAAENIQKAYDELDQRITKSYDKQIALAKANKEETSKIEDEKFLKLLNNLEAQYRAYRDNLVRQGKTLDDLSDEEIQKVKDFGNKRADLLNEFDIRSAQQRAERREKESANSKKAEEDRIAQNKKLRDLEISNIEDDLNKQRALATAKYNDEFILAKGNKDLILELRRQLDVELSKIDKEENDRKIKAQADYADRINAEADKMEAEEKARKEKAKQLDISTLDEEQRHQTALLAIKLNGNKDADTVLLINQIEFEEKRLKQTKKYFGEESLEYKKQANLLEELTEQKNKKIEQSDKERLIKTLNDTQTIFNASARAINDLLKLEENKVDKLISLQQKRVDEAAKIAENGNAELLELEKDRLEKLNKEKEKFVRAQQALATIELIANTAVTISKAAAEGGAGAAVTIAAALIALIAGLASARSLAGQAAFYEGGEFGYTGDGDKHGESTVLGRKPYIYHKKEFIFDNENTSKYLDIFRGVHRGEIDLNKIKFESDMYKMLRLNGINTSREMNFKQSSSNAEIGNLKNSMYEIVDAINAQERIKVIIDDKGIAVIANKYIRNQQRINNIAR